MIHPRPYLSYSQLSLFEQSEDRYSQVYFEGKKIPINRGMALGTEIADSLEKSEAIGDLVKDLVVSKFPKLDIMEMNIKATIKVKGIDIPLFGKLDSGERSLSEIVEYKTGKHNWTQNKVDINDQLTFYCTIIQSITGNIPSRIRLVHAPTRSNEQGNVELTGDIRTFYTTRQTKDILKMKGRMYNAWLKIGEMGDKILV